MSIAQSSVDRRRLDMAHIPYDDALVCSGRSVAPQAAAPRRGLLRRVLDALHESRQRAADREIARLLERTGGRMTDSIERQITERLTTNDWARR
jgi:hypothetical protein